jgi:hypothetical protein
MNLRASLEVESKSTTTPISNANVELRWINMETTSSLCTKLSQDNVRHKMVLELTSTHCSQSGIAVSNEVPILGGRLDLGIHCLNVLPCYADVSITHPCAKTYLDDAAVQAGSAALKREADKVDKYKGLIPKNLTLYPLVLETFGCMGKEYEKFLQKVASAFKRNRGKERVHAFTTGFIYSLSCTLQRGNAIILADGLMRAC